MSFLGSSVMRSAVCAVAVVVLAGLPSSSVAQTGAFTDSRDGKTYKTVKIGKQTWMARNLDFATDSGSWCYNDSASYCETYGRLYDWETAKKTCPSGYHLPTDKEWDVLGTAAGGKQRTNTVESGNRMVKYDVWACNKLKSKSGWNDDNGKSSNGTDDYGFSALPGGRRTADGTFRAVGWFGYWWTATVNKEDDDEVYKLYMDYFNTFMNGSYMEGYKDYGYSVRCVRDVKK